MALKYSDKAVDFHIFGIASLLLMLWCLRSLRRHKQMTINL